MRRRQYASVDMLEGSARGLDRFVDECFRAITQVMSNTVYRIDITARRIVDYPSRLFPALARFIVALCKTILLFIPAVALVAGALIIPAETPAIVCATLGVVYTVLMLVVFLSYRRRRSYYGYR